MATSQGWQERKVSGSSTNPSYNNTTSTLRYDAWGRRIEQEQKTQVPGPKNNLYNLSLYRYNGDGQVVSRREFATERDDNYAINKWWQGKIDNFTEAKPNTRFVYSGGQLNAELTEARAARDGQEAIEGTRYLAGTDGYAAGGGSVVVQAGETLYSLSQRVYGTSSYWYLLAGANGIADSQAVLTEGQSLQVPEVAVSRNDAGTFKPYNANEALGPTTPVLPYIPPSDKGCGVVGQLIMVVVAVIVTVYTAGAAASALGVTGTTAAGGGGGVVVQAGETLYSLSQRVYGSSSYWYLLAGANGIADPQAALTAGQSLQVPEVAVSRNDAGTFKPYNANEALGPTTPVLPYIPPSDKGCGMVGQLIMVVVAVIVTVYTAGAASLSQPVRQRGALRSGAEEGQKDRRVGKESGAGAAVRGRVVFPDCTRAHIR